MTLYRCSKCGMVGVKATCFCGTKARALSANETKRYVALGHAAFAPSCEFVRCKEPVAYRVERKWMKGEARFMHTCAKHIPGSGTGESREQLEQGNEWYGIQRV